MDVMKQYKNQPTNFAGCACPAAWKRQATLEAIIGTCYDKMARTARRRQNKSAYAWFNHQINSEGMPWLYHCGGAE